MRKALSILLITILVFFTIGPLPSVQAAGDFVGRLTAIESSGNNGKITVAGATPSTATSTTTITLYNAGDDSTTGLAKTIDTSGSNIEFTGLSPGRYYAKSTTINTLDGAVTVSNPSQVVTVKPGVVQLTANGNTIVVSNAIKSVLNDNRGQLFKTEVILYILLEDKLTEINRQEPLENGTATFKTLPAGTNYQARQIVNGVESDLSTSNPPITIFPDKLNIQALTDAGADNQSGQIIVSGAKFPNKVYLYDTRSPNLPRISSADEDGNVTFSFLPAGTYYAIQEENGTKSPKSDEITIDDKQKPVITLKNPAPLELTYPATFTPSINDVTVADNINVDPTKVQMSVDGTSIGNGYIMSTPGIYRVSYTITDEAGNASDMVTREITIKPQQVRLTAFSTSQASGATQTDGPNGRITVDGVYVNNTNSTTLYLYQDGNEGFVKKIEKANSNNAYIFENVPVGVGYRVIQEYTNANGTVVRSQVSEPVNVIDDTKPTIILTGSNPLQLIVGDLYNEPGFTATDNVDGDITGKVQVNTDEVNTNVPGSYNVYYDVTDKAGNRAIQIIRKIEILPNAVVAIGSTADFGEIYVKKALSGATLQLYRANGISMGDNYKYTLENGETTHTFKNVLPGSYYVTQSAGGFTSAPSNVVDVVDIDRPYITLIGPEKLSFVWGETKQYYNGETNQFIEPGATAYDYVEKDLTNRIKTMRVDIDTTASDYNPSKRYDITHPGTYKIKYSVTASRGTAGDDKYRILTIAPPKVPTPTTIKGQNILKVTGLYTHSTTTVKLYNAYKQLIETKKVSNASSIDFTNVPSGLGYYVTQTVNQIESSPSGSVNITLTNDAEETAMITSFEFKSIQVVGTIDQNAGTITVTVPDGTDQTILAPTIKTLNEGADITNPVSGVVQDFTHPLMYTVSAGSGSNIKTKTYVVTVTKASRTNPWGDTLLKNTAIGNPYTYTLTPSERIVAAEKGVSFISNNMAIYVPASNVKESSTATLTIARPNAATLYNTGDPSWKTSIENPIEINWGNKTSLYQPIEIELTKPANKAFVKLVRNSEDELYAIVQPSESTQNNTKIIGLVSEPGVYAFIEHVEAPYIEQVNTKNFRLYSTTTGADIYYTTNSKDISYNKPATNIDGIYMLSEDNVNLEGWTAYTNGETITIPGHELYAIAIKNQVISPVSHKQLADHTPWEADIQTVPVSKIWTITFNATVDKKAIYSDSIRVTDDSTSATVATTLQLSADGKSIHVIPTTQYQKNKQYTLWVNHSVKTTGLNEQFLPQPKKITFIAK